MNYLKGFFVSLSIHLIFFTLFILGTRNIIISHQESKAVDISTLMVANPEAKPIPTPKPKSVDRQPKVREPAPKHVVQQKQPVARKNVEKVTAPPVVNDTLPKPVVAQEPKLVSDNGTKEYVPVVAPTSTKLEKYSGSSYVGMPVENKVQAATVPEASPSESSASKYMRINIDALRKSIYSKLVYPPQARRLGMKGVTDLCFRIHKDGSVDRIEVRKSSGYELLDDAAKDAVADAAPLPSPNEDITIVLSVNFSLR